MRRNTFESFVNSERYKTEGKRKPLPYRLRALLIQKDTKLIDNDTLVTMV